MFGFQTEVSGDCVACSQSGWMLESAEDSHHPELVLVPVRKTQYLCDKLKVVIMQELPMLFLGLRKEGRRMGRNS